MRERDPSIASQPLSLRPVLPGRSRTERHPGGGLVDTVRRAPLMVKVAGATVPLLAVILLVTWWGYRQEELPPYALFLVLVTLLATVLAHLGLVAFALQPLAQLGHTVEAFSSGDESVDVVPSPWADAEVAKLELSVARLLTGVREDRERARALAARVLRQSDVEQGRIARELFDSTAQSMAALLFELRAATAGVSDARLVERLAGIRDIAAAVLDEVKSLSQESHVGWSAHHGLPAALQHLLREHNEHACAELTVNTPGTLEALDLTTAGLVYRTTQVVLRSAAQERSPTMRLRIGIERGRVVLDVRDEEPRRAIHTSDPDAFDALRARAELLGGSLEWRRDSDRRSLRLDVPAGAGDGPAESRSEEPR